MVVVATRRRATIALGFAFLLLLLPVAARAAPGSVDRSFGAHGFVDLTRAPAERFPGLNPFATDMATGPRGEILVLGVGSECAPECRRLLVVTRYGPDGSVDASYGEGGSAQVALGDAAGGRSGLLAVDSRGRAVIATAVGGGVDVARLGPDGNRDRTFATDGEASVTGLSPYAASRLFVSGGDKVVVESSWLAPRRSGRETTTVVSIARFRSDGAPDWTLGGSGSKKIRLLNAMPPAGAAVEPSGAVILAGSPCCSSQGPMPYVAKIRADGGVDRRFGFLSGLGRLSRSESIGVSEVLIRPSGKIDLAGSVRWGGAAQRGGFLIRLRGDGRPYRRFGRGGVRLPPWVPDAATLDRHGRMLGVMAAASIPPPTTREDALTVFRLTAGGGVDRSFGGGGAVHIPGASGGEGKIVAAYSGARPVVFNERSYVCREECFSRPVMVGLRGGGPWQGPASPRPAAVR